MLKQLIADRSSMRKETLRSDAKSHEVVKDGSSYRFDSPANHEIGARRKVPSRGFICHIR